MKDRIDFTKASPAVFQAMLALQQHVSRGGLERSLLKLVEMRSSQINGCAYCLDMHGHDARANGETEQRLYVLPGGRETTLYTERGRAALAWTEALTLLADSHVPDEVHAQASARLSSQELVELSLAIVAINGWNRLCVAFCSPPATRPQPAWAN